MIRKSMLHASNRNPDLTMGPHPHLNPCTTRTPDIDIAGHVAGLGGGGTNWCSPSAPKR
jgi:hypothetical protein